MKLIAYPESKFEPRKIVVHGPDGTSVLCQIYADGCISFYGSVRYPNEVDTAVLIRNNFNLFYENVENVNVNRE